MASFFSELKRRNVFRVAAAYALVAWLAIEIASVVLPALLAPDWVHRVLTFLVILGFPIALIFAWAYELTPGGLKREKEVDRSVSITPQTGRNLDFIIIGLLVVALMYFVSTHDWSDEADTVIAHPREGVSQASVAVLPFANRSALADDAFFAEGIHDDILTSLAKIGSLKVISRTSMLEYQDTTKNMKTIGEELGVATILEGGVQRAGDRVRINVQLIDTGTDEHLWAESFDRQLTAENVFSIQSEIATAIATALKAQLSPSEQANIETIPTRNLEAYDFYLRAQTHSDDPSVSSTLRYIELMEKAVASDPAFALAWADISTAYGYMYWNTKEVEYRDLALQAVERALGLDPDLPEAHLSKAYYHYWGFLDYDRALEELAIAERGMPGDFNIHSAKAYVLRRTGLFDEALSSLERARSLDPRSVFLLGQIAEHLMVMQRFEKAAEYMERSLYLDPGVPYSILLSGYIDYELTGDVSKWRDATARVPTVGEPLNLYAAWRAAMHDRAFDDALAILSSWPDDVVLYQFYRYPVAMLIGQTHLVAGNADLAAAKFEKSRALLETLIAAEPDDPRLHAALGMTYAALGMTEDAIRAGKHATELLPRSKDALHSTQFIADLAVTAATAGDVELATGQLDLVLGNPGYGQIEGIFADPRFDAIRDDPSFKALETKYRRVKQST